MRATKWIIGFATGFAAIYADTAFSASSSPLLLTGRVEYVSSTEGILYVLGNRIVSADAKRVVKGQLVSVYGRRAADGSVAEAQIESASSYSVGADNVYVRGVVSAIDATMGVAYVGTTAVSLTDIAGNSASLKVGDAIGLFGTQPAPGAQIQVRGAILSGGGAREAILSGGGERESILSGGGQREAILSGGGERESILSGGGQREAILSGGGERESILSGGGEREAILSGGGERESILSGGGQREAILSGGGERESILSGGGQREAILSGGGERESILSGGGQREAILSGGGERESILSGGGQAVQ